MAFHRGLIRRQSYTSREERQPRGGQDHDIDLQQIESPLGSPIDAAAPRDSCTNGHHTNKIWYSGVHLLKNRKKGKP